MNLSKSSICKGFGDEWERFDQSILEPLEHRRLFDAYFKVFPWKEIASTSIGFDLGCGSGRWAKLVAPRVGELHCIDPSSALEVAKQNLSGLNNCRFHLHSVDDIPIGDETMDFGYSLGVLHHVPDTQSAIVSCVKKLKPGAPFLLYLYYAFDNKPYWYKLTWKISDGIRFCVSHTPHNFRYWASQIIAFLIYLPIARIGLILEKLGLNVENVPLSAYRKSSFYTMRTDALDRFGTRLEKRYSKSEITDMMEYAGLEKIQFSTDIPYWCAIGYKKK